jgi:hypothetical protein
MGHKGHYGHYTGNARHSVNSWEEEDVKKGRKEEREGHKGHAEALFDDAHGSYNYDGHNSTGAERKGAAQWNYNQAPSAAYTQFDTIPHHLRFGQMDAAAMSNSERGNDPFATTGQLGNPYWTDSSMSTASSKAAGTQGGPMGVEQIVNQSQPQNDFAPLAPPTGNRSQKEKFVRHQRGYLG